MRPWILLEANLGQIKENQYEVAVLPLGATEPHNLHLPYGTDVLEGTIVGESELGEPILGSPAVAGNAMFVRSHGHLWKIATP